MTDMKNKIKNQKKINNKWNKTFKKNQNPKKQK